MGNRKKRVAMKVQEDTTKSANILAPLHWERYFEDRNISSAYNDPPYSISTPASKHVARSGNQGCLRKIEGGKERKEDRGTVDNKWNWNFDVDSE